MKVMILAAGRGERMRPLSDRRPKVLLEAAGRPLIVHLIERLARAGFRDLVVNVSYRAVMIERALGDGAALGVRIAFSREPKPLETAGGIARALPLLGARPFAAVSGDIYCDFDFARLRRAARALAAGARDAHLVLVGNPPHHRRGDFGLRRGTVMAAGAPRLTFSGIGVYAPRLFAALPPGKPCRLADLLAPAIARGRVSGERHRGLWIDVGTPQRLAVLERVLARGAPSV